MNSKLFGIIPVMIAAKISKYKTMAGLGLAAVLMVVLMTACRTAGPRSQDSATNQPDEAGKRDIARLYEILGVTAKSYDFDLQPGESLLVRVRATKNGVDEKSDTFTHEVTFPIYEKFDRNYPTFAPLKDGRIIDVEIQMPGHTWNPHQIKVSVRVPGFDRFFYLEEPKNADTSFNPKTRLIRDEKNQLLELNYRYGNGDVRTLTVEAEIKSTNGRK